MLADTFSERKYFSVEHSQIYGAYLSILVQRTYIVSSWMMLTHLQAKSIIVLKYDFI